MDPQVIRNLKASLVEAKRYGHRREIAYYREVLALAKAKGA